MPVQIRARPAPLLKGIIQLPLSKSHLNRLHILRALSGLSMLPSYPHEAKDSLDLKEALTLLRHPEATDPLLDSGSGGTSFRFLLAFAVLNNKPCRISISEQLAKRPHDDLLKALLQTGNHLIEQQGRVFTIRPEKIGDSDLQIQVGSAISSQFASALLLATANHPHRVILETTTSVQSGYLTMTLDLLEQSGKKISRQGNFILVEGRLNPACVQTLQAEADWSAAAVWFAWAALSAECNLHFPGLLARSKQPDAHIAVLMKDQGVLATEADGGMLLRRGRANHNHLPTAYHFDVYPDLYPVLRAFHFISGKHAEFLNTGSLPFKESNRTDAMNLLQAAWEQAQASHTILFANSFDDHRIAFAASLYSVLTDVQINPSECINKSYPSYYEDLKKTGFEVILTKRF